MSTLTTSILNALSAVGIDATEIEMIKNGVSCTGFRINNGSNISPVIYYSSEETIEMFVERVLQIVEQPSPAFDIERLISKETLLTSTLLSVQRKSSEDLVKWDLLDLELIVRICIDVPGQESRGSIKVTPQILAQSGLCKDELFDAARTNSAKVASITSMAQALGAPEELFSEVPFWVGTYKDTDGQLIGHGAGILALPEVIHDFCISKGYAGKSIYILPSSTEEILLLPMESANPLELSELVSEINASSANPILQLESTCYVYDDNTMEVRIASAYYERKYKVS